MCKILFRKYLVFYVTLVQIKLVQKVRCICLYLNTFKLINSLIYSLFTLFLLNHLFSYGLFYLYNHPYAWDPIIKCKRQT